MERNPDRLFDTGNLFESFQPLKPERLFDLEYQNAVIDAINEEGGTTRAVPKAERRWNEITAARGADIRRQWELDQDGRYFNANGHYFRRDKPNSMPEYSVGQYEKEVRDRHLDLDNIRKHYGLEEEDIASGQNILQLEREVGSIFSLIKNGKAGSPEFDRLQKLENEIEEKKTGLGEKLSSFRRLLNDRNPKRKEPGALQKTLSWIQGNGYEPEERRGKAWGRFNIALKDQYDTELVSPQEMAARGKLGFLDTLREVADNPTSVVPFLQDFDIKSTHIQDAAIRQQDGFQMYLAAARGNREIAERAYRNDRSLLEKYKNDNLRELVQGVGFWKKAGDVITQLPAYGAGIAVTGFGAGTLAKGLSKLPGAAKLIADTPKIVKLGASVVGNTVYPGRVAGLILPMAARLTNQQMLHEAVKQDESGNWFYDPEQVSPGTMFWDNVWRATFEVGSEMTGPVIGETASRITPQFIRRIGSRLKNTPIAKIFQNRTLNEIRKKAHIDGVPEEVLEETLNNLACYAFALETSGADDPEDFLDRMLAFAKNEPENMAVNAGIFAVLPAAGLMANTASTLASRRRQTKKLNDLADHAKTSFDEMEKVPVPGDAPGSTNIAVETFPEADSPNNGTRIDLGNGESVTVGEPERSPEAPGNPDAEDSHVPPDVPPPSESGTSVSDDLLPHEQVNPVREETPQPSESPSSAPSEENIYMRMPIERVLQDAENGVLLAKRALALRQSEVEQLNHIETGNPEPVSGAPENSTEADSELRILNRTLSNAYENGKAPQVSFSAEDSLSKKHLAVRNLMWDTFRKRIVYFEGTDRNLPDGASIGNDAIYVNRNASNPYLFVALHEYYHEKKGTELGREIADVLMNSAQEGSFRRWMDNYNANLDQQGYKPLDVEDLKEEFVADSLGMIANRESFWKEMAREKPNLLQNFLAWIRDLKESFSRRFQNGENVKDVIHDMERAERMITNIMKKEAARIAESEKRSGKSESLSFTTPQGEMKVNASYEVVDVSDLVTSDMASYDKVLQPRNRDSASSMAQIEKISSSLNPSLLLESPTTDTGAPLIDGKNQVISGNGRSIGIRKAVEKERAGEYQETIRKFAQEHGIEIPQSVKNPVLVRRISGKVNLEALAEFSNRDNKLQRSEAEQAKADAKTIVNNNLLSIFNPAEDGTILTAQNSDFTSQFIYASGDASMLDSEGRPSGKAESRIRNAILGALFLEQKDSRDLIRRLIEQSGDLGLKRQIDGVSAAAGRLLQISESKKDYDLRDDLAEAFRKLLAFKKEDNRGKNLSEALDAHLRQQDFFSSASSRESELLFRTLGMARSVKQIREFLSGYADTVDRIDPNTENMFGMDEESKYEILSRLSSGEQMPELFSGENEVASIKRTPLDRSEVESVMKNLTRGNMEKRGINANDLLESSASVEIVDGKIGEKYEAHGIAKGSLREQLDALLNLLENGIDKNRNFFTAPFSLSDKSAGAALGTASNGAYKSGLAVVLSGRGKSLNKDGIQTVFINDKAKELIPALEKMFPEIRFFPLSENKHVLEKMEETGTGTAPDAAAHKTQKVGIHNDENLNVRNDSSLLPSSGKPASESSVANRDEQENFSNIPGILNAQLTTVRKASLLRKYAKDHGMTVKQMQEAVEAHQVKRAREIARDPKLSLREKFERILAIYEQQPPLNERTSGSIQNQAYSTPLPLAFLCGEAIHIDSASAVYEPTAGNGALLISADPDAVHANEIEETRRRTLEDMRIRYVTGRDATGYKPGGRFDAVIMNPPFGTLKEKIKVNGYYNIGKLEHQIAVKALETLAPDGRAAMILGASLDKGKFTSTEMPFMNYLYNNFKVADNFEVDGELYRKQGASYPVRVILLSGRLAETDNHEKDAPKTVDRLKNWNDIYNRMEGMANETDERRKTDDAGIQRRGMEGERESPQHDSLPRAGEGASENIRGGVHDAVEFPAESVQGRTGDRTSESEIHTGTGKGKTSESAVDGGRAGLPGDMGGRGNLSDQSPVRASDGGGSSGKTGGAAGRHASGFVSDHSGNDGRLTQTEMTPAPSGASAKSDVSGPSPATSQSSNDLQNRYQPKSKAESLGTMIPKFMRSESEKALTRLQERHGDIDEFVRESLGYDTKEELYGALAAEQIDSVALAIDNIEKGESIIIGDQTGIGKGRQAAAIMRYAKRHGITPVFFTEKPKLFSDMYSDGLDIGERFKPFLIGNKDESHIKNSENNVIQECMSPARQQKYSASFMKENPEKFDAVFCCYSQVRDKENWQKNFFRVLFRNKPVLLVMDEAHNASGDESNTNKFFRELLGSANLRGTVFLSATYAKRPDNMVLFAMKNKLGKIFQGRNLVDVIKQGGLALQQVISQGLAEAGQLIRRERDFTGVKVNMDVQKVSPEIIAQYDQVSNFMSELVQFSEDLKESMKDENVKAGKKQKSAVETCSFGSLVHNYIAQLIFASKLDLAAKHAVKAHQNGQKPVIALANTLESFLKDYMEKNSLSAGDAADVTFRDVLVNALEKMKFGRRNDKGGNSEIIPLTFKPEIQVKYNRLLSMIDEIDVDLPASPIDYLKAKLEAAGLRVGELTGRENIIQYDANGENGVLGVRKNDANGTVNDFNSGKYDAVILNRAGATGLSLHSSEKFKDRKQRHMFVVQADLDINIVQQMLGRVLRSGQVNKPEYTFLSTDLEAERRVMSILKKKLASLSANTTANTKSGMQLKGEDFLNKYGDQVVSEFLLENPIYMLRSGISVEGSASGKVRVKEDIARNFTGKMALFSNHEQRMIYDELSARYSDLVNRLKATGDYDLEITDKDWRAEELSSENYDGGDPDGGIFEKPLVMKTLKTHEKQKVPDRRSLTDDRMKYFGTEDIPEMREKLKAMFDEQRGRLDDYYAELLRNAGEAKEKVKLIEEKGKYRKELDRLETYYRNFLGFPLTIQEGETSYHGTISNIRFGKTGNPGAASNLRVSFLVESPVRISAQASQIGTGKNIQIFHAPHGVTLDTIFNDRGTREFETERRVFVGNILKGVAAAEGNGKIVRYTTSDGRTEMGVAMPSVFRMSDLKNDPRRKLNTPDEIIRYLNRHQEVTGDFGLEITQNYGAYRIYVDKKKASGGQIYLDSEIRNIVGEFRQNRYRNNMELENHSIDEKTFRKVLPLLMAKTQISGDLENMRKFRGSEPAKLSVPWESGFQENAMATSDISSFDNTVANSAFSKTSPLDHTVSDSGENVNPETENIPPESAPGRPAKLSVPDMERDGNRIRGFFSALFEKDVNAKTDVNPVAKHLGTIFHYSRKVPSLFRTYLAASEIVTDKTKIRDWILNGDTGRDIFAEMSAFKKRDPEHYRKMNEYLLERDKNRDGLDVALRKDEKGREFFAVVRKGVGTVSGRYESEDEAWESAWSMERRDLVDAGFGEEAAEFVYQWRHIFDRQRQVYKGESDEVKKMNEDAGEEVPFIDGIDLDAELNKMGRLRGSYFPRIRHGNLLIHAEKEGENPRTEAFTNQVARAARAAQLREQGYHVTLKRSERPSEEAFSASSVAALNDFVNKAFNRMNAKSSTTFRDFGLMPEYEEYTRKDGTKETHLILRGNKRRFDRILKNFGGQYYKDGWRFRNVDPAFEKSLLQAVAVHVGVVAGDVNLFGKVLAEQLALLIHSHGSRSAMIGRSDATGKDVHLGYEEDALTALALSVSSAAGGLAKGIAARKMLRAFTGTDVSFESWLQQKYPDESKRPDYGILYEEYRAFVDDRRIDSALQPRAFKSGTDFMTDVMRNDTDTEHVIGVLRGVMATYYLSRPSSGIINLSTMFTNVPAMMSAYGGVSIRRAGVLLSQESKRYLRYLLWNKYGKGKNLSEEDAWVYRKIHEYGWDESQMSDEMAGEIMTWGSRAWRKITGTSLLVFASTEQFNRNVTIAAAFRGLMEQEKGTVTEARREELLRKAKNDISDRAHGVYGKINLPDAMRGASAGAQVFRSFYSYKTYTHNYLQSLLALGLKRPKEIAWMVLSPAVLAGAPATVLTPLAALVFSSLGLEPPDGVEAEFYRWMRRTFGTSGERFGRMGVAGLAGVNLTGSMSMMGVTELPTSLEEVLGAPYSMSENIVKGIGNAAHGNFGKAAEQILPAMLSAPVKAAREAVRGVTKKNNQPVIYEGEALQPDMFDTVMRSLGFNPASISEKREKLWEQQRASSFYRKQRSEIYNEMRDWYVSGRKSGEWARILRDVEEYNARVRRSGRENIPLITEEVIKRTIRNASKGRR